MVINHTSMSECLFCKIADTESEHLIYQNDAAFAILDIFPRAPGHSMVIPKIHAENILDLPDDKIEKVFKAVKDVTGKLKKSLKPDGFTIGINHGKNAGQAIDHLHVHIIPRYQNDGGGSIHGVVHNPPKETLKEIKNKIISQ